MFAHIAHLQHSLLWCPGPAPGRMGSKVCSSQLWVHLSVAATATAKVISQPRAWWARSSAVQHRICTLLGVVSAGMLRTAVALSTRCFGRGWMV